MRGPGRVRRAHLFGPRGLLLRLPPVLWLTLVWIMLWGTWSWGNLVTGLIVAVGVTVLLPLPRVVLGTRVHPLGLARFLARFGYDLVASSLHVAWRAIKPGPGPTNAVVAIRLRSRSDLLLTVTSEALTLIPGSIVIEVAPAERTIYAHVFDVTTLEDIDRFRAGVLALEARVIRALGSHAAIRELDAEGRPAPAAGETR
jgi:multicomponent Na+:H+ antiporter subunit E